MKSSRTGVVSLILLSSLAQAQAPNAGAPESSEAVSPPTEVQPAAEVKPATDTQPAAKPATDTPKKASPDKKKEIMRVTGSRMKQIDVEKQVPIAIYGAEDIKRSGQATVSDFIRNRIPSGGMTSENETLQQSAGTASFGGRDFDPEYTLILVNGRRIPTNAIADDYVDLNLIPLAAVERIEYLTDGASAIYGSDAVAGVLNIITKKDFDGTSFSVRVGQNMKHKDGTVTSLQMVSGVSSDKGNFLIATDLFKREAVEAKDRPYINSAISPDGDDGRSPTGLPGYVKRTDDNGTVTKVFNDCPEGSQIGDNRCYFDFAPLYQVNPKSERQSIYTIFDRQLTDDVEFFGEARFSRSSTSIRNGAAPGAVQFSHEDWNKLPDAIKAQSPFFDPLDPNKVEADDVTYTVARRFLDFGPRATENYNESFNLVAGLTGELGSGHSWEFVATKHRLKNLQFGVSGNIDESKAIGYFQEGILNPFVFNTFDTPDQLFAKADMETEVFRLGESDLETYGINFDGTLPLTLTGGPVTYATGIEYRKESYFDQSDSLSQTGNIAGSAGGVGGGGQETQAGYLELALPFWKSFDIKGALRSDAISSTQGSANRKAATTYKLGATYAPIEQLKLRSSYGTGFKAAPLHSRFLQSDFGVQVVKDSVYCASQNIPEDECDPREVNARSVGNPDLDPEKTAYFNAGIVVQPTVPLSLSLDYWHLVVKDKIGSLGVQYLLNNEADYSEYIKRAPDGTIEGDSNLYYVESKLLNLNENRSAGLEFAVKFQDTIGDGRLESDLRLTRVVMSKGQETPSDPLCDFSRSVSSPNANLSVQFLTNTYSLGTTIRYDSAYDTHVGGLNPGTCDFSDPSSNYHVRPYVEVGLSGGIVAPFGTEFGLGVQNVADAKPAYDRNAGWPWFSQQANGELGRTIYATIAHQFN